MPVKADIAIIGAGLAGLAAAGVLAGHPAKVVLLDENRQAGGQYLRRLPPGWSARGRHPMDRLKKKGLALIERLEAGPVEIIKGAAVLGLFPGHLLAFQNPRGQITELQARTIILATGARERFLPFPGWTLPGVISTGAAQIMMKSQGILPAEETLVAGRGPLPLIVAAEIIRNHGRVKALLDQTEPAFHLRHLKRILSAPDKIGQGLLAGARLLTAGVPIRTGAVVVEARGRHSLEEVVIAKSDDGGRARPGTTRIIKTRSLAVGHGFAANIELAGQAGCRLEFDPDKGGWVVAVDALLGTSLPGVYAAGEITGLGGAYQSYLEGQLAGWSAARSTGLVGFSEHLQNTLELQDKLKGCRSFGQYLNSVCRPNPAQLQGLPDETIICRCENLALGRIRQALAQGFGSAAALKKASRCQMGPCQGRTCGPIINDILLEIALSRKEEPKPPSFRFPVKAMPLGALLED